MMAEATGVTMSNENPGLVARLGAKAQRYKTQVDGLQRELELLKTELAAAQKDREEFRLKADSSSHLKELERLRGEIRLARHRHEFDTLAREAGANPKALDDVFASTGWKAETDEIDLESMKAAIQAAKENKDYLFSSASGSAPASHEGRKPAPGSGKGAPVLGGGPVISEDLASNDPGYVMRNYDKIAAYYKSKYDVVE